MTPSRAARRKLNVILFAMCALFVALGGRLYFIQVLCHEEHRASCEEQTRTSISLPARRGDIVDRRGRRLVVSVPAYTVAANLQDVSDPVSTASILAPILKMPRAAIIDRLRRKARFVYLKRKVAVDAVRRIQALKAEGRKGRGRYVAGIHLLPDSRRSYVCGRSACHLLGFTRWYPERGDTGQEGAERALDSVLRGRPGKWELRRDGRCRKFGLVRERQVAPVPGHRVRLTLDLAIQRALEEQLENVGEEYRPESAFGLVMDPQSGRLLAMASWPDFDPNSPGDCVRGGRLNRTVTTVLEPGSTMKPVVAAIALEEGTHRPWTKVFCEKGAWQSRRGRTITDSHPYGWLSFSGLVIKSSNIGLAKVGRKLGPERLDRYCRAFGFGRATGLGLPGESGGILRPRRLWTGDSVLSIPFGHEISVTPLQLVSAYGALANGGTLYRPQMVERIEDAEGNLVQEFPPAALGRVISRKTSEEMREILEGVVQRGTGKRARLEKWSVGGKTGTARKLVRGRYSDRKHYSSFVAFAPVEKPRMVVLITVDEPKGAYYGGTVAAPRVAAVLRRGLTHLGVPASPVRPGRATLAAASRRDRNSRRGGRRRR